jgi:hypothetical protein
LKAQPPGNGDRVHEQRLVAFQHGGIAELLANGGVMRRAVGLIVAQAGVWATDEHGEITAIHSGTRPNRVALPALDGEIARLEIHEQGRRGVQRPQQRGFPNSAAPEDAALDAARFGESLISSYDWKSGHRHASMFFC